MSEAVVTLRRHRQRPHWRAYHSGLIGTGSTVDEAFDRAANWLHSSDHDGVIVGRQERLDTDWGPIPVVYDEDAPRNTIALVRGAW